MARTRSWEWIVDVDGRSHTVRVDDTRQFTQRIHVDDELWHETPGGFAAKVKMKDRWVVPVGSRSAVLEFRATRYVRGCTLTLDGRTIPYSAASADRSSAGVVSFQLVVVLLIPLLAMLFVVLRALLRSF
ncbi:MAG: hypothetical protein ACF8XB_23580 [Planctomycetota bacterium JB042]